MDDNKNKELNQEELGEVSGGFGGPWYDPWVDPFAPAPVIIKPRPEVYGTCNECAIKGKMNVTAYFVPGSDVIFCLEEGHIYRHGAYDHTDKNEARNYFN